MRKIRANFHTHTCLCDGVDTPQEVAAYAKNLGFTALGFSGHMDPDIHMDIEEYYRQIFELKKAYEGQMEVLCGIELDALYDSSCAYAAEYVIGSTHFLEKDRPLPVDLSLEALLDACRDYYGGDPYALCRDYYELESTVFERTGCTFVGHFDLVVRFNDEHPFVDEEDPRYLGPAMEAMEHLAKKGLPFEINCGAVNRGRKKDFYPNRRLLSFLHELGGEILISSDAHQKELLDGAFPEAAKRARECGFTHILTLQGNGRGGVEAVHVPLDEK